MAARSASARVPDAAPDLADPQPLPPPPPASAPRHYRGALTPRAMRARARVADWKTRLATPAEARFSLGAMVRAQARGHVPPPGPWYVQALREFRSTRPAHFVAWLAWAVQWGAQTAIGCTAELGLLLNVGERQARSIVYALVGAGWLIVLPRFQPALRPGRDGRHRRLRQTFNEYAPGERLRQMLADPAWVAGGTASAPPSARSLRTGRKSLPTGPNERSELVPASSGARWAVAPTPSGPALSTRRGTCESIAQVLGARDDSAPQGTPPLTATPTASPSTTGTPQRQARPVSPPATVAPVGEPGKVGAPFPEVDAVPYAVRLRAYLASADPELVTNARTMLALLGEPEQDP